MNIIFVAYIYGVINPDCITVVIIIFRSNATRFSECDTSISKSVLVIKVILGFAGSGVEVIGVWQSAKNNSNTMAKIVFLTFIIFLI